MSRPADPAALARWRADTPGCERRDPPQQRRRRAATHAGARRHRPASRAGAARSAATRPRRRAWTRSRGAYAAVGRAARRRPRNLAMQQNSTVAFAQAFAAFDLGPGDLILTSRADYASNQIMYLALARRRGVEVVRAPDAPEGGIDPQAVRELIGPAAPHAARAQLDTHQLRAGPARRVGRRDLPGCGRARTSWTPARRWARCRSTSAGCTATTSPPRRGSSCAGRGESAFSTCRTARSQAGAYPLTVDMHGATGATPDQFALTPDARRFESWEISYALVLGMGAAAEYALAVGVGKARERSWALAAYARERLAADRRRPGARPRSRTVRDRHRGAGRTAGGAGEARAARAAVSTPARPRATMR